MKQLNHCNYLMARYLYKKWKKGMFTEKQMRKIFTFDTYIDIIGGWFYDFYMEELYNI